MANGSRRDTPFVREAAKRVFATELREARIHFKDGEDEKSPTYVLLPTGERCNRVFLVGTLTEKRKQGEQNVFYRGRVVDPTGTSMIMAGSYQPEAMQQLARIEPPAFVAVVGKPNVYETPDGTFLITIRCESVTVVDKEVRDTWVLDAAETDPGPPGQVRDHPGLRACAERVRNRPRHSSGRWSTMPWPR